MCAAIGDRTKCVWVICVGGCAHEVGWQHEIWSGPTLKTEAQRHWDEFAGLEESMAYKSERPIRVGVWPG